METPIPISKTLNLIPVIWSAIVDFNLGRMDSLINYDAYRYPEMVFTSFTELNSLNDPAVVAGAISDGNDMIAFSDSGLEIELERMFFADRVGLCLDSDDAYRVEYWDHTNLLASDEKPVSEGASGLICYFLDVPQKAYRTGYNIIRVFPTAGDGNYKAGHIRLVKSVD